MSAALYTDLSVAALDLFRRRMSNTNHTQVVLSKPEEPTAPLQPKHYRGGSLYELFDSIAAYYAECKELLTLYPLAAYDPDRMRRRNVCSKRRSEWCTDFESVCKHACHGNPEWEQTCISLLREAGGYGKAIVNWSLKDRVIQSVGKLAKSRGLEPNRYFHRIRRRRKIATENESQRSTERS